MKIKPTQKEVNTVFVYAKFPMSSVEVLLVPGGWQDWALSVDY